MQRWCMQIQRPCELSGAPRTVSEMIRQSNLGSDLDDLGNRAPRFPSVSAQDAVEGTEELLESIPP